jgi:Zn-dependent M28 family amino/carboxypeptidase
MKQLFYFGLLIIFSCQSPVTRNDRNNWIDTVTVARHIKILASDDFQGRKPFTLGETKTVAYLKTQFEQLGLLPGNNESFFQAVPMLELTRYPTDKMIIKNGVDTLYLDFSSDFVCNTEQNQDRVALDASEVVFAGFGIVAPEYDWDDYEGIDVKGKTVLVMINDPGFKSGDPTFFKGDQMTYYGRWTYKFEEAARQGAAGIMIIHETEAAGYPWAVLENSGSSANLTLDDPNRLPTCNIQGWITQQAAVKFFQFSGKDMNQEMTMAGTRNFRPVDLSVRIWFDMDLVIKKDVSQNVIAKIAGTDYPDEVIIYCAHWDHLGIGLPVNNDSIYNGAHDNASGTAMLLALAEAFKLQLAPKRTVVFLALTGEEQGLLGSAFYANNAIFDPTKTVAVINIDGLAAYGKMKDLTIIGYGQSELEELAEQLAIRQDRYVYPDPHPSKGYFFRSDHFNFAKIGIPSLFAYASYDAVNGGTALTRSKYEYYQAERYHGPADEFIESEWQFGAIQQDGDLYYQLGWQLANDASWPKWKEGSEFKILRGNKN